MADRILCSEALSFEMPVWRDDKSGKLTVIPDGIVFQPSNSPRTVTIELSLPKEDYKLYDQLQFDITATNADTRVSLFLQSSWPRHADLVKKQFRVKKGTHTYTFYMHQAGYRTVFRDLVLKLEHNPDEKNVDKRSELSKPITFKDFRLNAMDYSLATLGKQMPKIFSRELPCGFSPQAVAAAEAERQKLRTEVARLFAILKNRSSNPEENRKSLSRLYELRQHAEWLIQSAALQVQTGSGIIYGWTGGIDKILRDGPFPGIIGGTARVSMGRNEHEGMQIALYSAINIKNVKVTPGTFTNVDGNVFPAGNIHFGPLGYIDPTAPAYFSNYINYLMPDPVLNYLTEFDVDAEKFQPIWFDFYAPTGQEPGTYSGTVKFSADGIDFLEVPVQITVHKFTLPDRMTFPVVISSGDYFSGRSTLMRLYEDDGEVLKEFGEFMFSEDGDAGRLSTGARRLYDISVDTFNLLRDHRISYHDIYRSTRDVIPAWRRRIINEFNTMYCLGYDNDGNVMNNFKKQFEEMRKEGTANRAYIYGYDEIREHDKRAFASMKKSYGELKKAFPELKTMATALDSSFGERTDTTEEVDIWVTPPNSYLGSRKAAERARERGKQVWWYPCNWPYPPNANLLLESQATATRLIIGFMPWKYEVDGFLYYSSAMLDHQVDLETLVGRWDTKGGVKVIKHGNRDYNSEYLIETTSSGKNNYAEISKWTRIPEDISKPLVVECDIFPEKYVAAGKSTCSVEIRLNYQDGKTDKHFLKINPHKSEWQSFRQEIKITKPLRNMLFAVRVNSPAAVVHVKNLALYQEKVYRDTRFRALRRLAVEDGILLSKDFSYSMFRSNGDGTLIYPGPDGAIPTVRLKLLRDGLEDYEYLVMLKAAVAEVESGKKHITDKKQWLDKAKTMLVVLGSISNGLSKYPRYGQPMLEYRAKIAELLDQVN
ncbi:MAG: DUF4091 domain-containing protein [Victivallales bacterium]|nr:DUF4091 domain-containing protein [Victivallales bacterium]